MKRIAIDRIPATPSGNSAISAVAYAITGLSVFGAAAASPALPLIGKEFTVSDALASLLISLFILPMAILIPIAGILAEIALKRYRSDAS